MEGEQHRKLACAGVNIARRLIGLPFRIAMGRLKGVEGTCIGATVTADNGIMLELRVGDRSDALFVVSPFSKAMILMPGEGVSHGTNRPVIATRERA